MNSFARRILPVLGLLLLPAVRLVAQDNASVEALAPVLATEDARQWNDAVLRRGTTYADTVVRSRTALAIGRIGDPQGMPLLLTLLDDPEDQCESLRGVRARIAA